jgi:hypothetical protein
VAADELRQELPNRSPARFADHVTEEEHAHGLSSRRSGGRWQGNHGSLQLTRAHQKTEEGRLFSF